MATKRQSEERRRWYVTHKLVHPHKHRDWRLRARYGITLAEMTRLRRAQQDRCAICLQVKPLVVDHDHKSKRVRSLLCRPCNLLIGYAHEDVRVLDNAVAYLNFYDPTFTGCAPRLPKCA